MGESAHVQGLASHLTDLIAVLCVLLIGAAALVGILLYQLWSCLARRLGRCHDSARRRALEAAVKQLPTRMASSDKDLSTDCAICLETFSPGVLLRVLPCSHAFHAPCIDLWLEHQRASWRRAPSCPMCKAGLPPTTAAAWLCSGTALDDSDSPSESGTTQRRRRRDLIAHVE